MTDETQQENEHADTPRNAPPPPASDAAVEDLTDEQLQAAADTDQVAEGAEAGGENDLDAAAEIADRDLDTEGVVEVPLNAANRICVQLRRIADALGHDTIPFDSETDFDDVERVERRLMDIVHALEGRTWGQGRTPGA